MCAARAHRCAKARGRSRHRAVTAHTLGCGFALVDQQMRRFLARRLLQSVPHCLPSCAAEVPHLYAWSRVAATATCVHAHVDRSQLPGVSHSERAPTTCCSPYTETTLCAWGRALHWGAPAVAACSLRGRMPQRATCARPCACLPPPACRTASSLACRRRTPGARARERRACYTHRGSLVQLRATCKRVEGSKVWHARRNPSGQGP